MGTLRRKSGSGRKSIIVDESKKAIWSLLKEDDTYIIQFTIEILNK